MDRAYHFVFSSLIVEDNVSPVSKVSVHEELVRSVSVHRIGILDDYINKKSYYAGSQKLPD